MPENMSEPTLLISEAYEQIVQANCGKVSSELDDLEVPEWLNESFIQNILRNEHKDSKIEINSMKVQECGGKGENYASLMFRVLVDFRSKDVSNSFKSYIVKSMSQHELAKEKLGKYDVQRKEMDIYQRILPEFKEILENLNENCDIFPKALAIDQQQEVIVLEDLVEKNFTMADRIQQLDLVHSHIVINKLAQMHAASIVVNSKDPNVLKSFNKGMLSRNIEAFHCFFNSHLEALGNEVSEWPGYSYYAEKLIKMRPNLCENASRVFDLDENDLHVLVHGDLWTNNVMFKYNDNNEPVDVILLDFQFCCYGSPAIDLLYFIHTSCIEDLRENRVEELIQFYYNQLKDILNRLNYNISQLPTLHQFQQQMLKKYFYAFTSSLVVLPLMLSKDCDADFEALMMNDLRARNFKKRIYKNPVFQKVVKQMLPTLDRKGLLDAM